jgi:hypothetical protein
MCLSFFGFGLAAASSLQVGQVSVSDVGFVFSLNTTTDNDFTTNDA